MSDRDNAIDHLWAAIEHLGVDELRVLERIAKRLEMGRKQYGDLNVPWDRRDFREEARQEVEDMLVYFACGWLKNGKP
jgi:hypothetical protein